MAELLEFKVAKLDISSQSNLVRGLQLNESREEVGEPFYYIK